MANAATLEKPETEPHHAGDGHGGDHGHDDHGHHGHPSLAHHFEDLDQQFDAGKLGMWLFLAQEVLFFAGLFTAYAVYRYHHPEVFVDAHHHLNTTLGAINTVVLLASSLAVAWGVRAAMLDDRKTVLWTHVFTLGCAAMFMGVKTIEYTHKWDEGIGAGNFYTYVEGAHTSHYWHDLMPGVTIGALIVGLIVTLLGVRMAGAAGLDGRGLARGWVIGSIGVCIVSLGFGIVLAKCIMPTSAELAMKHDGQHGAHHAGAHDDAHAGEGHGDTGHGDEGQAADGHSEETPAEAAGPAEPTPREPRFGAANFFSIYFIMTGVHAVHILAGIVALLWVVGKAAAGEFSSDYFLPVENVGLYWHLVDLVWIYLFPLMYLIH